MTEDDARYFAGLMEDFLEIPAFVCEVVERYLMDGKFESVCEYVVQRKRELEHEQSGDIPD